jgi:hypothetical protein
MNPDQTVGASQPPSLCAGFGITPIHSWRIMAWLIEIKEFATLYGHSAVFRRIGGDDDD